MLSKPRLLTASGLGIASLALALALLDRFMEDRSGWLPDLAVDFLDRFILIAAAVAATFLAMRFSRLSDRTDLIESQLDRAAGEGRAWRAQSRRFLDGLGRAIERQFEEWGLTPAEADVAGLLLKGASLREIAALRRTSEATTRQQAQHVYRKSGLGSRAELSAYFLEDLFSIGELDTTRHETSAGMKLDA